MCPIRIKKYICLSNVDFLLKYLDRNVFAHLANVKYQLHKSAWASATGPVTHWYFPLAPLARTGKQFYSLPKFFLTYHRREYVNALSNLDSNIHSYKYNIFAHLAGPSERLYNPVFPVYHDIN